MHYNYFHAYAFLIIGARHFFDTIYSS